MSRLLALSTAVVTRPARTRSATDREAGMTTAEYSVGTIAACGFGAVLYKVITSDGVLQMITDAIGRAFSLF